MTVGTSFGSLGEITFMCNPVDDTISGRPEYNKEYVMGQEVPKKEYKGHEGEEYTLELLFDDSFANDSGLCSRVIGLIRRYAKANSSTGAPPAIFYNYGSDIQSFVIIADWKIVNQKRNFENEIKRLQVEFKLLERVNTATRTPREQKGEQYVIVSGKETFRSLAHSFLEDASLWKHISKKNRSLALSMAYNPIIPGGAQVVIPAWSEIAELQREQVIATVRDLINQ